MEKKVFVCCAIYALGLFAYMITDNIHVRYHMRKNGYVVERGTCFAPNTLGLFSWLGVLVLLLNWRTEKIIITN